MKRTLLAALSCLFLLAGCASKQPAAIGEDAVYTLEVTNSAAHAMTVSLDLGAGQNSVLGELQPGQTRTFEVKDPSTNDITLKAASSDKSHTFTDKIELSRSKPARVTLK